MVALQRAVSIGSAGRYMGDKARPALEAGSSVGREILLRALAAAAGERVET